MNPENVFAVVQRLEAEKAALTAERDAAIRYSNELAAAVAESADENATLRAACEDMENDLLYFLSDKFLPSDRRKSINESLDKYKAALAARPAEATHEKCERLTQFN